MLSYVQHETNYFEVIVKHYLRNKGQTIETWMSDMRNPSVRQTYLPYMHYHI